MWKSHSSVFQVHSFCPKKRVSLYICMGLGKYRKIQGSPLAKVIVHLPLPHRHPKYIVIVPWESGVGLCELSTPGSHSDDKALLA